MEILPHPGPQYDFLSTTADIAIYGGQAGGGKTWALIVDPLRYIQTVAGFGAVIFRRTSPQIRREGGLWDESQNIYRALNAYPRESTLDWLFPPHSNRIQFSAMEYEQDRFDWDGSQIPVIGFDQLEHFTEKQFFYMLSRNRTTCGIKPYIRATANPDPDSWLKEFISWWLDDRLEYPSPTRANHLRYFIRIGDDIHWASSRQQLITKYRKFIPTIAQMILSVTFIPATIQDNPTLLKNDPLYLAKLAALPRIERERLERGNWLVRPSAGSYFKREYFTPPPTDTSAIRSVRWWDLAATEPSKKNRTPDYTVGLKLTRSSDKSFTIEHVYRDRLSPYKLEKVILSHAQLDGHNTVIGLSQDPGAAGKAQIHQLTRLLSGYMITSSRETGDKTVRAMPAASQAQQNNIYLIPGRWNEPLLRELENFPNTQYDDQVDALSAAFNYLTGKLKAGTWGR